MFRAIDDFLSVWKDEAAFTSKVFETLTDASLERSIHNDHRTIGRLAWHLTQTIPEMLGKTGLALKGPSEHDPVPASASAIARAYAEAAASVAPAFDVVRWTDAELETKRPMYGEEWTVGFVLRAFVLHQVHHRAQITVLMRQAGLKVPGLYGPSKEDWANYGVEAPAI